MDAKTRYRRRLQIQFALTRVLEVIDRTVREKGIPPDPTTGKLAALVVRKLIPLCVAAGVEWSPGEPDLSRVVFCVNARKRRTRSTKKSRTRRRTRTR